MAFTRKDIIDYYDKTEISYRLWWDLNRSLAIHFGYTDEKAKTFRESLIRFNEVLAQQARIGPADRVMDAGCGVGGSSIFLARTCGCRADGVTVCPPQAVKAAANARERGVADRCRFHEMDYCSTGFKDGSFSVVWGLESICYAESKRRFVHEAYRLLKPGGRLIVADGFAAREHYEGRDARIMDGWLSGWAVNALDTGEQFTQYGAEAGFRNMSFRDVSKNVFPSSRKLFLFSIPAIILAQIQYRLGFITWLESIHSVTLYYQYVGLKKRLWQYGVFYAEK
ncbi:MAG: methyltransferase domain-containing protein [Chitinivibrionales bacterium]|nr:methyltransferase domain-containing protein [Chitinivibrionales bacterium]MBD3394633.1 methyltransferase domain-containing protein [Chitinivibrionales bacterium]